MNRYYVLLKVMEKGSFTKAAKELGYTQSAVSQMVHSLEKERTTTFVPSEITLYTSLINYLLNNDV